MKGKSGRQQVQEWLAQATSGAAILVVGGPGTGKTTLGLDIVRAAIECGTDPAKVVMLVPNRSRAAQLRTELETTLRRPVSAPLVRTPASLAFALVSRYAINSGQRPPHLILGADQDAHLEAIIAGHDASQSPGPDWPAAIRDARKQRAFRDELRNLLMRMVEFGWEPEELAAAASRIGRPEWKAVAELAREYFEILDVSREHLGYQLDSAMVMDEAARIAGEVPFDLVVVDDYHDATAGVVRMLHAITAGGAKLVLTANPDTAVQGFRGAQGVLLGRVDTTGQLGAFDAQVVQLGVSWRLRGAIASLAHNLAAGLPATRLPLQRDFALAVPQEEPATSSQGVCLDEVTVSANCGEDPSGEGALVVAHEGVAATDGRPFATGGSVEAYVCDASATQSAQIASLLRLAVLREGIKLSDIAVIVRSAASAREIARGIRLRGVLVDSWATDQALADEAIAGQLLEALEVIAHPERLPRAVLRLATSCVGGMDVLELRELRRQLDLGGQEASLAEIARLAADPLLAAGTQLSRLAAVLAAGKQATPATVADVLWAVWETMDCATSWQDRALAGDGEANHNLDVALALFAMARMYVERFPDRTLGQFVTYVRQQEVPADVLVRTGVHCGVTVTTPAGAAGREWHTVIVAGVNEGVWPTLRIRDTLLHTEQFADVALGRDSLVEDPRRAVLADEQRLFLAACTRAKEHLVVLGVENDEETPSRFFTMAAKCGNLRQADGGIATVRDIVARGRIRLESAIAAGESGQEWAELLARLSDLTPVADPQHWQVPQGPSCSTSIVAPGKPLRLSPSKAEMALQCPLRYVLSSSGGDRDPGIAASVGTLIHEIAEAHPTGGRQAMQAMLTERVAQLGLVAGWEAKSQLKRLTDMLERYDSQVRSNPPPLACEAPFRLQRPGVNIFGTIDRIEPGEEGTCIVRDIKTGTVGSRKDVEQNLQLAIYQLAVNAGAVAGIDAGIKAGGAQIVGVGRYSSSYEQSALEGDPDGSTWIDSALEEVVESVTGTTVVAQRGSWCTRCPVTTSCPAQAAGLQVHHE